MRFSRLLAAVAVTVLSAACLVNVEEDGDQVLVWLK